MEPLGPDARRLRASDADRDRVLADLREHAAAGRLDVSELQQRVGEALESKTLGELEAVVSDLPPIAHQPPVVVERRWRDRLGSLALQMFGADVIFVAIWAAAGRGYFWPVWLFIADGLYFLQRARRVNERQGPRPHPRHYDGELRPPAP